ncbi:hypothetical protein [Nocardia brasiliensis]|nr:hypothetical protein [Nocardia brasiliensis]
MHDDYTSEQLRELLEDGALFTFSDPEDAAIRLHRCGSACRP